MDQGAVAAVIPAPVTSLSGTVVRPQDVPAVNPGSTWLRRFKPGKPRPRPPAPPSPAVKLVKGSLSLVLPLPVTSLSGLHIRSPENLGASLVLAGLPTFSPLLDTVPNEIADTSGLVIGSTALTTGVQVAGAVLARITSDATCTLRDYDATLVLADFGATLAGWTMQTAPLTLSEFNDVTIDIAVTSNGSPYNLTSVTVNMLLKSQAGVPDSSALIFSSGGGSPAITITNAAAGLAVAQIPNADLDAEVYSFYRVDVVNSGLTNTCVYGPVNWITL
jgi:hypothetical protein